MESVLDDSHNIFPLQHQALTDLQDFFEGDNVEDQEDESCVLEELSLLVAEMRQESKQIARCLIKPFVTETIKEIKIGDIVDKDRLDLSNSLVKEFSYLDFSNEDKTLLYDVMEKAHT